MAAKQIQVCTSTDCGGKGSSALLRDLEDLCAGSGVEVQGSTCLNHCGKGPNVQVVAKGKPNKVVEKIDGFKVVEKFLKTEVNVEIKKLQKQVAEIKYDVRRSKAADERKEKLQKAFKALGGEDKAISQEPRMASQLLVMRSRELVAKSASDALQDAQRATELCPDAAAGFIALSLALEKLGKWAEALKAADTAIEKGEIREGSGLQRRLKDKVKEQDAADAKKKADEEAADAKKKAEAEAEQKKKDEAERKKKAAADAKKKAAEAKKKAEAEAKKKAEEEAARKKVEEEEAERQRLQEEEEKARAEAEAKAKAEEEERLKKEEEARRKAEEEQESLREEARRRAEAEAAEQARRKAEIEEARRVYEASLQGKLNKMFGCCRPPDGLGPEDESEAPVKFVS